MEVGVVALETSTLSHWIEVLTVVLTVKAVGTPLDPICTLFVSLVLVVKVRLLGTT